VTLKKVVINDSGRKQVLRLPAVRAELERKAGKVAEKVGDQAAVHSETGPNRARAVVATPRSSAAVLKRAIDAGKG
jgi:hypothetical protein